MAVQNQVLQQQIAAGLQSSYSETEQDNQPSDHAAEDSGKCLGTPAFSERMEFLPMTIFAVAIFNPICRDVIWILTNTSARRMIWRRKRKIAAERFKHVNSCSDGERVVFKSCGIGHKFCREHDACKSRLEIHWNFHTLNPWICVHFQQCSSSDAFNIKSSKRLICETKERIRVDSPCYSDTIKEFTGQGRSHV